MRSPGYEAGRLVAERAEDWVRNLRAAKEAMLTRGHRREVVTARELPTREAVLVLQAEIKRTRLARYEVGVL